MNNEINNIHIIIITIVSYLIYLIDKNKNMVPYHIMKIFFFFN